MITFTLPTSMIEGAVHQLDGHGNTVEVVLPGHIELPDECERLSFTLRLQSGVLLVRSTQPIAWKGLWRMNEHLVVKACQSMLLTYQGEWKQGIGSRGGPSCVYYAEISDDDSH